MKKLLCILVVLASVAGLTFAGGTPASETKTLVYATTEKLTNLDPAEAYDFHTWEIFQNIYQGLLGYAPGTTDIVPGLAESYTINDAGDEFTFKLRQGVPIACYVTLRGRQMYEFYDRLVNIVLPRVRDFRGVPPSSFDGRGNYTLGMRDQLVFPEIDYTKVERPRGMNITVVTTARNDREAHALLQKLGMPFREA